MVLVEQVMDYGDSYTDYKLLLVEETYHDHYRLALLDECPTPIYIQDAVDTECFGFDYGSYIDGLSFMQDAMPVHFDSSLFKGKQS